jgi:hypothetical protein
VRSKPNCITLVFRSWCTCTDAHERTYGCAGERAEYPSDAVVLPCMCRAKSALEHNWMASSAMIRDTGLRSRVVAAVAIARRSLSRIG